MMTNVNNQALSYPVSLALFLKFLPKLSALSLYLLEALSLYNILFFHTCISNQILITLLFGIIDSPKGAIFGRSVWAGPEKRGYTRPGERGKTSKTHPTLCCLRLLCIPVIGSFFEQLFTAWKFNAKAFNHLF